MFSFFKSPKALNQYELDQIVVRISGSVLNTLGSSFLSQRENLSDYRLWVDENNNFIPPGGFWEDQFILGFTQNFVSQLIRAEFSKVDLAPENQAIILGPIFKAICSRDFVKVMQKIVALTKTLNNMESNIDNPSDYEAGAMIGSCYGRIITGKTEEISLKENSFFQEFELSAKKISQETGQDHLVILAMLFKKETLDAYIKEKFPLNKLGK